VMARVTGEQDRPGVVWGYSFVIVSRQWPDTTGHVKRRGDVGPRSGGSIRYGVLPHLNNRGCQWWDNQRRCLHCTRPAIDSD